MISPSGLRQVRNQVFGLNSDRSSLNPHVSAQFHWSVIQNLIVCYFLCTASAQSAFWIKRCFTEVHIGSTFRVTKSVCPGTKVWTLFNPCSWEPCWHHDQLPKNIQRFYKVLPEQRGRSHGSTSPNERSKQIYCRRNKAENEQKLGWKAVMGLWVQSRG